MLFCGSVIFSILGHSDLEYSSLNSLMIKKLVLVVVLFGTSLSLFAQQAHKLRIGADFGYAKPSGGNGLLFAIEPKYNVVENVSAGFRWEVAYMTKELVDGNGASSEGSASGNSAYLATLDYYFDKEGRTKTPYVGLGLGAYSLANVSGTGTGSGGVSAGNKFGCMLRMGLEVNRFRVGVEYNAIPSSKYSPGIGGGPSSVKNSYFGFHIGMYMGGGQWGVAKPKKDEEKEQQ